ncbi:hypothetical protein [Pedobacter sp. UBA4863]|uniref:hypothetical protein n=1 Tax=Pedobacter sp. UBA4863 TaxID=1947060 RepID=UPI0025E785D0|nr:hypothetical protein [Pedobacter sp. UBA4863]
MRNLKFIFLAVIFALFTGMQCRKDGKLSGKEELPPITQDGRNTFGFLLNGEIWIPRGGMLNSILDFSYFDHNGVPVVHLR